MKNKLKTKDLIFAGIFGALYIVVMMITVSIVGLNPITFLSAPFFVGITGAPVYILMTIRIKKFGAALILSVLLGLIMMAATPIAAAWAIVCGIIAEIIIRAGKYQSQKAYNTSFMVFALSTVGTYLAIWFAKDNYIATTASSYGQEYANQLSALTPWWAVVIIMASAVIGAFIGTRFTNKILKKHFERAELV